MKYMIVGVLALVACGGSSASVGGYAPDETAVSEDDGTDVGGGSYGRAGESDASPGKDAAGTADAGTTPGSEGGSSVDAGSVADSSNGVPDAGSQDSGTSTDSGSTSPNICGGYIRVHVAVGTCVRLKSCEGDILIGSDGSLGAGSGGWTPGSTPSQCIANDQNAACLRLKHPSSTNPQAFDSFIKPDVPANCTITTYAFMNNVCPVSC